MPERDPQLDATQLGNKTWWGRTPMAYDWREDLGAPEGTAEFYDEIDRRFFASSTSYGGDKPFARLIPYERVRDKDVLEVGCGLGSHAQLLCEAGARYNGVDLTEQAVALTTQRLEVRGLSGTVQQMDAEHLSFADASFDFVWSWGVIHHSSDPVAILRQMYRVLRPGGEVRLMVYNSRSITAFANVVRGTATGKGRAGMTHHDMMSHYVDGFVAQHYTEAEFADIVTSIGFEGTRTCALGQKIELLPIPGAGPLGPAKRAAIKLVPDRVAERTLSKYGWFLFATARKPL